VFLRRHTKVSEVLRRNKQFIIAKNVEVGEEDLTTINTSLFLSQQHMEQLDDGTDSRNENFLGNFNRGS